MFMDDSNNEGAKESNVQNDENMPKDALTVGQCLLVDWKGKK